GTAPIDGDPPGTKENPPEHRRARYRVLGQEPGYPLVAVHEHGIHRRVEVRDVVHHQKRRTARGKPFTARVHAAAEPGQRIEQHRSGPDPETTLFTVRHESSLSRIHA